MISIIIPTKDEEKYLPMLLTSIKNNNYPNKYEIIVADANSKDNTVKISKSFGCKVIKGGMPGIARNNGAKVANGDILMFIDADMILPPNFIGSAVKEFKKKSLSVCSCDFVPFDSRDLLDLFLYELYNLLVYSTQCISPHASGMFIMIKKKVHDKINGFDSEVVMAEDHDYVRRAGKISKFRILTSTFAYNSIRRLKREGRFNLTRKYLICEMHRICGNKLYKSPVRYKLHGGVDVNINMRR